MIFKEQKTTVMMTYSKARGPVSSVGCVGHCFKFGKFGCVKSLV